MSEVTPDTPAALDWDAYVTGLEPATFKAPLYRKPALIDRIDELAAKIDEVQKSEAGDRSMAEGTQADALIAEHNDLVAEFEASVDWFEFRPVTQEDVTAATEKLEADGKSAKNDNSFVSYQMAETCVSHPGITGAVFDQIRAKLGDKSMAGLWAAWFKALNTGGDRGAPFSPRPLPTRVIKE